jgi:hypothetical protein
MDPKDIHTTVIDGCGRCKAGTMPLGGSSTRCVPIVQYGSVSTAENKFNIVVVAVGGAVNTSDSGGTWVVHMDVESRRSTTMMVFFLTTSDELPCLTPVSTSTCLDSFSRDFKPILWDIDLNETSGLLPVARSSRGVNLQYLQFDRGRTALVLNRDTIRSWAICSSVSLCEGKLGVLFIDVIESSPSLFFADVIRYPLIFELDLPPPPPIMNSMVFHFSRYAALTSVEIHNIVDKNQYVIWVPTTTTTTQANNNNNNTLVTAVKWDDDPYQEAVEVDGIMTFPPPPIAWLTMRIIAGGQQYTVVPPVPVVVKGSSLGLQGVKKSIQVKIAYGLELKSTPKAGDTEQLITISAVSNEPVRLMRLSSNVDGLLAVYTSPKGFITDTRRALDLVVACNGMMSVTAMVTWLESIIGLMDTDMASFTTRSCDWVRNGNVSKLYWLVPVKRANVTRNQVVDMKIETVFS